MISGVYLLAGNQLVIRLSKLLDDDLQPLPKDLTVNHQNGPQRIGDLALISKDKSSWIAVLLSDSLAEGDVLSINYKPTEFLLSDMAGEEVVPFSAEKTLERFPETLDASDFVSWFQAERSVEDSDHGVEITSRGFIDENGYLVAHIQPKLDLASRPIEEDYQVVVEGTGKTLTIADVAILHEQSKIRVLVNQRLEGLHGAIELRYSGDYSSLLVNGGDIVRPFNTRYPISEDALSPSSAKQDDDPKPSAQTSSEPQKVSIPAIDFKAFTPQISAGVGAVLVLGLALIFMLGGESEDHSVPAQTANQGMETSNSNTQATGSLKPEPKTAQVTPAARDSQSPTNTGSKKTVAKPVDQASEQGGCPATLPNGAEFIGQCENGKPGSEGELRWFNGAHYVGALTEGQPSGDGSMTYPSGDKYEGEFARGVKHGYGRMTWTSGAYYEGEYVEGKRNGFGVYYYKDGRRYEGLFKNGHFTNEGNCYPLRGKPYAGRC